MFKYTGTLKYASLGADITRPADTYCYRTPSLSISPPGDSISSLVIVLFLPGATQVYSDGL